MKKIILSFTLCSVLVTHARWQSADTLLRIIKEGNRTHQQVFATGAAFVGVAFAGMSRLRTPNGLGVVAGSTLAGVALGTTFAAFPRVTLDTAGALTGAVLAACYGCGAKGVVAGGMVGATAAEVLLRLRAAAIAKSTESIN